MEFFAKNKLNGLINIEINWKQNTSMQLGWNFSILNKQMLIYEKSQFGFWTLKD